MDEKETLLRARELPPLKRVRLYLRLTGPGYLQSAMTLGGGSVASCVVMGSLLGYKLLWVQPLAIILGCYVLASVAKQTCHTQQRPYKVFWERLHPALAILWGGSALIATVLWHIPQYSLTANGVVSLAEGAGVSLDSVAGRAGIGAVVLCSACVIVYLYHAGARGLKIYELAVKTMVWSIVVAFAIVAISSGIQWKRLFLGFTGIAFLQDILGGQGLDPRAIKPIVGGVAAAVGINMVFLYPYSLLNKNWGKEHKELAYFDLISGMLVPFLIATSFMMIAVANTIGPADGQAATNVVRDIREIVPVLAPSLGKGLSLLLIGFGMIAIGFSTIITHMLATGFIGCEMFGFEHRGRARWWFSLVPAVGVVGVAIKFPWYAAITASTLAAPLMPVAVVCFMVLLNQRSYMGDETPRGGKRLLWNVMLSLSVIVLSVAAYFGLQKNWQELQKRFNPPAVEVAALAAPAQTETVSAPALHTATHRAMGTEFMLILHGDDEWKLHEAATEVFERIDLLNDQLNRYDTGSDVSWINTRAATAPVKAESELFGLLEFAAKINKDTGGAFDITVGPLMRAWGFFRDEGRIPGTDELGAVLEKVGQHHVLLDADNFTVRFDSPDVEIDLGGIAKGYALDQAVEVLKQHGIDSALVDAGTSSIYALGTPPGEEGWQVGIRDPMNKSEHLDTITLKDAALSTSGNLEKFFEIGGKVYGHIMDPRTGMPVQNVLSASAIAPTGTESDALSTAFFVMGQDGAQRYCEKHPGVKAVLVVRNGDGEQPRTVRFGLD